MNSPAQGRWGVPVGLVSLAAATLWSHRASLHAGWNWCDDYTVAAEPRLRTLAGLAELWREGNGEQYVPLTATLWSGVGRVFGFEPLPFHLLSLLLHVLAGLLLFALLHRWSRFGALLASAVFLLHPLQVESVAWIYQSKTLLSNLLVLLAAWAFTRGCLRGSRPLRIGALLSFGAAVLAKPSAVVWPWVGLWLTVTLLRDPSKQQSVRSRLVPFLVLSAVGAVHTLWYEHQVTGAVHPMEVTKRPVLAATIVVFYLRKLIWPQPLSFAYGPIEPLWTWLALLGAVVTASLLAARRFGRVREVSCVLGGIGLTLAPVAGLAPIYMFRYTFVADHLASNLLLFAAPAAGLALAAALHRARAPVRMAAWVGGIAGCALLAAGSARHAPSFHSEETAFRAAIGVDQRAWLAHLRLALIEREAGRPQVALAHLRNALAVQESAEGWSNAANLWNAAGFPELGLGALRRAEELAPDAEEVRRNLASALALAGALDPALERFRDLAGEPSPAQEADRANVHALVTTIERLDRELQRLDRVPRADPRAEQAWLRRRADVLLARGRERDALDCFERLGESALRERARVLVHARDPALRDPATAHELLAGTRGNDRDPGFVRLAAEAAAGAGDREAALALLERAEELTRGRAEASWYAEYARWFESGLVPTPRP